MGMDTSPQLSALHIFRAVQSFIASVDTSPLLAAHLRFNQEQYNQSDDDVAVEFPFARLDTGFPESNTSLGFMIDFYSKGIDIAVLGNGEPVRLLYDDIASDNEAVASALIALLTVLGNGQVKLLLTCTDDDDERLQAVEVLYRPAGKRSYDAIISQDFFMKPRQLRDHSLKTTVITNSVDLADVPLATELLQRCLVDDVNTELMAMIGRKRLVDLNVPLTPEVLKQGIDAYAEEMGERAGQKVEAFLGGKKSAGAQPMSFWEEVTANSATRHIDLLWGGFLMLAAPYWIRWDEDFSTAALAIGGVMIILYFVRKKLPQRVLLYGIGPLGYGVFILSAVEFISSFTNHWVWWAVAIAAVLIGAATAVVDVRLLWQRRARRSS